MNAAPFLEIEKTLDEKLLEIEEQGMLKKERLISSPQDRYITIDGRSYLNLCSNNYLGLANHPKIIKAAQDALLKYGYGMASVRFICGTLDLHKELEERISSFLGTEDTILFSSCFDANGGVFESLLGEGDAIISDSLNHASIIDGVRLCKAERHRYPHGDMAALEEALKKTQGKKNRCVVTDGVFSMDGDISPLDKIIELAHSYGAFVVCDDCHATGVIGPSGRGTASFYGLEGKVDLITSTFGKALGGASGGFISGSKTMIAWLRQKARPYLFSNTLMPAIAAGSIAALDVLESEEGEKRLEKLHSNSDLFRSLLTEKGVDILSGKHPIIPVMLFNEKKAAFHAEALLEKGINVISFSYPVVPLNTARIRTQMNALLEKEDLHLAAEAFATICV